ncbi:Pycsar system effector family protein [Paractinoplanes maris]|uniref:Pycsar system effector family protein n=1 Tax=Paractinoplanes maris TaxID=1734446 RepID=UPI00202264F4|nr:Pycsar system effector family protein [Actinoplanes maris]
MTIPSTVDPAPAVRLAERLLGETREELRRADARATQWVAAMSAGSVTIFASWTADRAMPWQDAGASTTLAVAAAICATAAVIAHALALLPRTTGGADITHVAYFGHVNRIKDPRIVRRHLEEAAADTMPALVTQLCWLSRLAAIKYRYIRIGTVLGASAGVLVLLTVI